jgi:hypothetical protein
MNSLEALDQSRVRTRIPAPISVHVSLGVRPSFDVRLNCMALRCMASFDSDHRLRSNAREEWTTHVEISEGAVCGVCASPLICARRALTFGPIQHPGPGSQSR